MRVLSLLFFIPIIFYSCGKDPLVTKKGKFTTATDQSVAGCTCTYQYEPVCAEDGRTYDNECIASCFGKAIVKAGSCCDADSGEVCGKFTKTICPEGQMCAQVIPSDRTFENECKMEQADATLKHSGPCNP